MHPACCSLHFEVVHRAMELWLSCPWQTLLSSSELCAADCRSHSATAWATSKRLLLTAAPLPLRCSLWMLNYLLITQLLGTPLALSCHLSGSQTGQLLMNGVIYSSQSVCPQSAVLHKDRHEMIRKHLTVLLEEHSHKVHAGIAQACSFSGY